MPEVVGVRFHGVGKAFDFAPGKLTIKTGDCVIVETSKGVEFGIAANAGRNKEPHQIIGELKPILRLATENDIKRYEENLEREAEAYPICRDLIDKHGLDMYLVSVEYSFDDQKIIFYFTAENRIDFRELVKDLAQAFHRRIELRQIGVRDEARMVGGVGICGRSFCCASFLDDFVPVSIKMAKFQSLSMNPSKISGCCGRLMCCLKYEQDAYEEARKRAPKQGADVRTPRGAGKVLSVNLLKESLTCLLLDSSEGEILQYQFDEVEYTRSAAAQPAAGSSEQAEKDKDKAGGARRSRGKKRQADERKPCCKTCARHQDSAATDQPASLVGLKEEGEAASGEGSVGLPHENDSALRESGAKTAIAAAEPSGGSEANRPRSRGRSRSSRRKAKPNEALN